MGLDQTEQGAHRADGFRSNRGVGKHNSQVLFDEHQQPHDAKRIEAQVEKVGVVIGPLVPRQGHEAGKQAFAQA